ncbi:MAG TPA: hypothetical protein PK251_04925 [Candidatus Latescibacteria bacterium]|nr:hypothetical protein [Candidatus Latescibacterota bacterium]HOS64083.1 hypothetical protein [Candidatus Latescibacterota bacterium]HPK75919.1 hypothetical protein [Candidatus Latescibacterota bacterium]
MGKTTFASITAWFHGSPLRLTTLRKGSTITPDHDLARVFSHRPSLVSIKTGPHGFIKHSGTEPGFLYFVEVAAEADVIPPPTTTMEPGDEWITTRDLPLRLIGPTVVREEERLSDDEVAEWKARVEAGGRKT